tara:strand:- start:6227 stop:6535 length:309 start_codon:yes stop_codon:yes gene_type:complete
LYTVVLESKNLDIRMEGFCPACMEPHDERNCEHWKAIKLRRPPGASAKPPPQATSVSIKETISREAKAHAAALNAGYETYCKRTLAGRKCPFGKECRFFHFE